MLCHCLTEPEFSFTTRFHAFTGASVMLFVILQRLGSGGIHFHLRCADQGLCSTCTILQGGQPLAHTMYTLRSDMSTHDIVHVDAVQDKVYLQLLNLGLSIT